MRVTYHTWPLRYETNLWSTHVNIVRPAEPIRRCVRWRTRVFKIEGFVCKRFLPSPPPPPVPRSFFAPKLNGNACYAGYVQSRIIRILQLLKGWGVHFVYYASYASLFAMKLEKLRVNDKTTAWCQTNTSPKHYIKRCKQVTNTRNILWKTFRQTSFQKPQSPSVWIYLCTFSLRSERFCAV